MVSRYGAVQPPTWAGFSLTVQGSDWPIRSDIKTPSWPRTWANTQYTRCEGRSSTVTVPDIIATPPSWPDGALETTRLPPQAQPVMQCTAALSKACAGVSSDGGQRLNEYGQTCMQDKARGQRHFSTVLVYDPLSMHGVRYRVQRRPCQLSVTRACWCSYYCNTIDNVHTHS